MVSDPLTDGWYVGTSNTRTYPMLIVCPNCSTSYTIAPGSLGAAGRTAGDARARLDVAAIAFHVKPWGTGEWAAGGAGAHRPLAGI